MPDRAELCRCGKAALWALKSLDVLKRTQTDSTRPFHEGVLQQWLKALEGDCQFVPGDTAAIWENAKNNSFDLAEAIVEELMLWYAEGNEPVTWAPGPWSKEGT